MSRRHKHFKTPEELRLLARSQSAESSAALIRATSELATTLGLQFIGLTREPPIATTQLTDGCITIKFLYGPPEFHVEMYLSHRRHPNLWFGLSELCQHRPIQAWMAAWPASQPILMPRTIESEVDYFRELLTGPCAEAFTSPDSFFNHFSPNDRNA